MPLSAERQQGAAIREVTSFTSTTTSHIASSEPAFGSSIHVIHTSEATVHNRQEQDCGQPWERFGRIVSDVAKRRPARVLGSCFRSGAVLVVSTASARPTARRRTYAFVVSEPGHGRIPFHGATSSGRRVPGTDHGRLRRSASSSRVSATTAAGFEARRATAWSGARRGLARSWRRGSWSDCGERVRETAQRPRPGCGAKRAPGPPPGVGRSPVAVRRGVIRCARRAREWSWRRGFRSVRTRRGARSLRSHRCRSDGGPTRPPDANVIVPADPGRGIGRVAQGNPALGGHGPLWCLLANG